MPKPQVLNSQDAMSMAAGISQANVVCHCRSQLVSGAVKLAAGRKIGCDSFSSAINAAIGSELGGARTFVLSSGLESSMADAAHMRLPIVVGNISENNDAMFARDSGAMIFLPKNNLEAVESIIQAYKTCEDPKVLLPAIVDIDMIGFSESVTMPSDIYVKRLLSTQKLPFGFGKKPSYFNVKNDPDFKKQQQKAMQNSIPILEAFSENWKKNFKHSLPLVENYRTEDAETILVMSGFHSTTAKAAIDSLRNQGKKVGLARIRVLRPFPKDALQKTLKEKKVIVFDQAVSPGSGGILFAETRHIPRQCFSFISIGKYPSEKTFIDMFSHAEKQQKEDVFWL